MKDPRKFVGVKIKVTDYGIGISEQDKKNLFTMFFQSKDENSRRMNQGSHGIGLNICRKFALNLGGDLTHNDEVTKGAEFVLSLTLEKVEVEGGAGSSKTKSSKMKFG